MKIVHAVGARPNFMKTAPVVREMSRHSQDFEQVLVHTGQHYDDNMSAIFFDELDLPQPDVHLGVGSGSHADQTARIMLAFEPILLAQRPDWVVVVGDVNSTLACALTAAKLGIRVAHIEAGLRSFDRTMPEELNRVLADHVADLLFTHSPEADANLRDEGIAPERIHFVGNVMIDTLVHLLPVAERRSILANLDLLDGMGGLRPGGGPPAARPYLLVTLHRPANVDDPRVLATILAALDEVSRAVPVIFPIHPRTRRRLAEGGWQSAGQGRFGLRLLEPLGYVDFLALERAAAAVLTDSGGIQEETTYLGVPCLTVRPNTERPVTITGGTNRLVPVDHAELVKTIRAAIGAGRAPVAGARPELWDGRAAERIVSVFRQVQFAAASAPEIPGRVVS